MFIHENFNLKAYNTFGVDARALYAFFVHSNEDILRFVHSKYARTYPLLILGKGSNILFTKDFEGIVLIMQNKGIRIESEDEERVRVQVAGGELWDDFVSFTVNQGYAGAENLSLIPGTAGAAPIQNIGAYGVEQKDIFYKAEGISLANGKTLRFFKEDCLFTYRNSIFKNKWAGKIILTDLTFELSKKKNPKLNLTYGGLNDLFSGIKNPTPKDVRKAIIEIRTNKLPAVEDFPNAGSFFKNPVIDQKHFANLQVHFPDLVSYPAEENKVKLAAGQLIDSCGLKGARKGNVGTHDKQALVIVNHGKATGKEISDFSKYIQTSVYQKFKVKIEPEVNII